MIWFFWLFLFFLSTENSNSRGFLYQEDCGRCCHIGCVSLSQAHHRAIVGLQIQRVSLAKVFDDEKSQIWCFVCLLKLNKWWWMINNENDDDGDDDDDDDEDDDDDDDHDEDWMYTPGLGKLLLQLFERFMFSTLSLDCARDPGRKSRIVSLISRGSSEIIWKIRHNSTYRVSPLPGG